MIREAEITDLDEVFAIYRKCDIEMQSKGFTYWIDYPKKHQTERDIKNRTLFTYSEKETIKAVITLDEEQFYPWKLIKWHDNLGKALVVHRLAVHPDSHGNGIGQKMMKYAESYASEKQFSSIRLDASSDNKGVHSFYTNLGYVTKGEIYLPVRDFPFICYEKVL